MPNIAEIILEFKIAQLEGKLAIYKSLITDIAKLEAIERATSEVKLKLEDVTEAWHKYITKESHGP